uniref:Ig-like domain-containing protein n=1 Tax=Latimeria chalumnae TaxID=7897 RepID=H3A510_LATCH
TTDPSPVTAQLGSDIVLKCDFTVNAPTPNLDFLNVKWFLNDKLLVEFNDKLIPSSFRVRMSEREIKNGSASLSISNVTAADKGDYKCSVLYTPDKEEKIICLKVEGKVRTVPKVTVSESLMNKDKVSVLTCEARGHYPKNITVEWRSDVQVQTGSILVTGENKDNTFNTISTYTITPSEQDRGKTYSCHVSHISLKEPIQEDMKLYLLGYSYKCDDLFHFQDVQTLLEKLSHNLSHLFQQNITAKWQIMKGDGTSVEINSGTRYNIPGDVLQFCGSYFICKMQHFILFPKLQSRQGQMEGAGKELPCTVCPQKLILKETVTCHSTATMTYSPVLFPARPEVSDIKEVPVSGEDEVKFTVDVSKFYPKEIQIHWSYNGKQLEGKISEPQCNDDGTYSVTNQIVIPEGGLKEKDQIKITIEHDSMEKPAVKEKTLQDPGKLFTEMLSGVLLEKTILGDRITLDCNVTGCLPKSLEIEWTKKKGKNITELFSSKQGNATPKYKVNNINGAGKSGHLQSILTFSPEIREDDEAEFACRFINPNTGMTLEKRSAPCKIMGKPTVSAIEELPMTDEEVVKFAVDVTEFYPRDIQIKWIQNGHQIPGQGKPQTNADGTYSTRQRVTIPEGDLKAGDKVGVSVEHVSLESALTKEITAVDTATRRGYRISKISVPQNVFHGEQTTLTCVIGGILPKSQKITWIKKMRGDEKIKYIAQSGADFSKSELLVSKLSFTPNIAEDEEAEFICRFSH